MAGLNRRRGAAPRGLPALALSSALFGIFAGASAGSEPPSATASPLPAERLFVACSGCHAIAADAPHGVGPNLHGLGGRRAVTADGFVYSPALQAADLSWDNGTLTAWILATEDLVPGTWMLYYNVLEPDEVERLVDWLLAQR